MAIISDCEFCNWVSNTPNATYTKQTEFYDGIDGLEDIQMCWQCGRAAKFEQERIIKLLEDYDFSAIWRQIEWNPDVYEGFGSVDLIALIKGENK